MLLSQITPFVLLAALGAEAGPGFAGTQPPMPEPIATRQTLFAIPFNVPAAQHPSQEPV